MGLPCTSGVPSHRCGPEPATATAAANSAPVATAATANATAASGPINIWWHLIWIIQYSLALSLIHIQRRPTDTLMRTLPSSSRGPRPPDILERSYPTHTITLHALVTLSLASYPLCSPIDMYLPSNRTIYLTSLHSHENASKSKSIALSIHAKNVKMLARPPNCLPNPLP